MCARSVRMSAFVLASACSCSSRLVSGVLGSAAIGELFYELPAESRVELSLASGQPLSALLARRPVPRRHQRHREPAAELDALMPVECLGPDRGIRRAHRDVVAERRDHARAEAGPPRHHRLLSLEVEANPLVRDALRFRAGPPAMQGRLLDFAMPRRQRGSR